MTGDDGVGAAQPADWPRGVEATAAARNLAKAAGVSSAAVRLLYWDGSGLWLMTKRLEQGTFAWPRVPAGAVKLSLRAEALELLLSGIDLKGAKLRPWWEAPEGVSVGSVGEKQWERDART